MTVRWSLLLACLLWSLFSWPVIGQTTCDQRTLIAQQLRDQYREQRTGVGIMQDGTLVELFTSADGSFTIIVTTVFGLSCVTLFGEDWERKDGKVFELEGLPPQQVH